MILPSGLEIVANADGTITAVSEWNDPLVETNFSYEVTKQDGITDVGFVTGEEVPCFVEGTPIETVCGPVPVEDIAVGDLMLTLTTVSAGRLARGAPGVLAGCDGRGAHARRHLRRPLRASRRAAAPVAFLWLAGLALRRRGRGPG